MHNLWLESPLDWAIKGFQNIQTFFWVGLVILSVYIVLARNRPGSCHTGNKHSHRSSNSLLFENKQKAAYYPSILLCPWSGVAMMFKCPLWSVPFICEWEWPSSEHKRGYDPYKMTLNFQIGRSLTVGVLKVALPSFIQITLAAYVGLLHISMNSI